MKTIIRTRAASLAIAGVAGIAGIGLASGPAMAASAPTAETASASQPQSVYYPDYAVGYADELVREWGQDNTDRVEALTTKKAAAELAEHGDENGTHWDRTGSDGAMGTIYVDYENTVTGETMSVAVSNHEIGEADEWGAPNAVKRVQFSG